MNYLQKTAIFIGIVTAINSINFAAHAQTCAEFSHTPVTKAGLDELAANQNIPISQVRRAFKKFALATIRPGIPIPENTKLFRSDDREIATDGKYKYVQPDGVLLLVVELFATPSATYLNSVFYEVKAVKGTLLPLVIQSIKFSVSSMLSVKATQQEQEKTQQLFFLLMQIKEGYL